KTPILSLMNQFVRLNTERQQRSLIGGSARKRHQQEDTDVNSKENVGKKRSPAPDGAQKLEVVFSDHCRKSCCNFSAISRAAFRAFSSSSGLNEIAATTA